MRLLAAARSRPSFDGPPLVERRPDHLLAGYDGSPESMAAVRWAAERGDTVIVATALPQAPRGVSRRDADLLLADQRRLAAQRAVALHDEPLLSRCAWIEATPIGHSPADALVECARAHHCEAIVIGRDRPDGAGVAADLLRASDVPVVVVPEVAS